MINFICIERWMFQHVFDKMIDYSCIKWVFRRKCFKNFFTSCDNTGGRRRLPYPRVEPIGPVLVQNIMYDIRPDISYDTTDIYQV
jgi:hypothetical protein